MNLSVADPELDVMDTTPGNQRRPPRPGPGLAAPRHPGAATRCPAPAARPSLAELTFEVGDVRFNLSDYMARRRTAGLLILKDGAIAGALRYGSRPGEALAQLLDRDVDDLDACRRRAPRWRDR